MQDDSFTISTADGIMRAKANVAQLEESHGQLLLNNLLAAAEQSPTSPVLLDLSSASSMPSMFIGALVTLRKKFQDSHQRFILVGLQASLRQTLAVCRLDRLFEMADNEQAAKNRIQGP